MQRLFNTYRWILAAWLMLSGCFWLEASDMTPSQSWGYKSVNDNSPIVDRQDVPASGFRSTSSYISSVNSSSYAPAIDNPFAAAPNRVSMYNPWDEDGYGTDDNYYPTGDEIGVIYTPVGEPLILLLMALLYAVVLFTRSAFGHARGSNAHRCDVHPKK